MDTTNTHIHGTLFLLGSYTSIKVAGLDYFYAMEDIWCQYIIYCIFFFTGISLIIGGLLELCNILFVKGQYYKPATGDFVIEVRNGTKVMEAETLDETHNCKAMFVLDS